LSKHIASFDEITRVFCFFHPFAKVDFLSFIDDFYFETKVILDCEAFIFTLAHSPHLPSNDFSDMVYEFL
jgi:hypothetical protein